MSSIAKKISQVISLSLYYGICRYLPPSTFFIGGRLFKWLRFICCKNIFLTCGENVNVERLAFFGSGRKLCIGDNSGLGINCNVPANIIIGQNVMMGPQVYILAVNHQFNRIDIPMCKQGSIEKTQPIIEDDVWIGRQVIFTPGRTVKKGSIIGAGTVLTKDFPEYSIVGGNPARLIKSRLDIKNETH